MQVNGASRVVGGSVADRLIAGMRQADDGMRAALAALREARSMSPDASGLPIERLAGLETDTTGRDVRFLTRAIEVLDGMPATWLSFQRGAVSWSQLQGIILAARPLRVADREWLDDQLAGVIDQGGEPDRVVEIAGDLAARCLEVDKPDRDVDDLDRNTFVVQPTLDSTRMKGWFELDVEAGATVTDAVDAAADPPTADDHPVDADGRPMPRTWGPCRTRAAQRAEGLVRIAAAFLAAPDGRQARPSCTVIMPIDALLAAPDESTRRPGHPRLGRPRLPIEREDHTITARVLWRLGGGRARITKTTAARLACDAQLIPMLVDDRHFPVAIGDAHALIPQPIRRAAAAIDQGCRFPGCNAPAAFTDLHHIIPREHGGRTELASLASLCRRCHTRVHQRGWHLTLHEDRTLVVRRGRWTFTSRPRGQPPPGTRRHDVPTDHPNRSAAQATPPGQPVRQPDHRRSSPADHPPLPF